MPHKYVTPDVIRGLEEEIAGCKSSIERVRSISRGGPDSLKELMVQVKEFLEVAREKKDLALDLMMRTGAGHAVDAKIQERSALLCRGQEKAFEIILDMVESPEQAIKFYQSQQEQAEKELAQYRNFEQRPK